MGPRAAVSLECVSSPPSLVAFLFQQKEARWENEGFVHKERKAPWFCFKSFFEWPDGTLHIWVRFFRLRLIYVNRLGVGLKTEDWSKVNPFFGSGSFETIFNTNASKVGFICPAGVFKSHGKQQLESKSRTLGFQTCFSLSVCIFRFQNKSIYSEVRCDMWHFFCLADGSASHLSKQKSKRRSHLEKNGKMWEFSQVGDSPKPL